MEIKQILLLGLAEANYSRIEFWQKYQKESGFSEKVFIKKLNECISYYENKISTITIEKESYGFFGVKYKLPLIFETGMQLTGHFGIEELSILKECIKEWEEQINIVIPTSVNQTETVQENLDVKPELKPESVQIVFDIIKDFFRPEQQDELKKVIETGNDASNKLLFKGNGNRLTDTFKKLIEHDFIIGCCKKDLINWIIRNFTFVNRKMEKPFIYDTVEKTISRNDNPCKSPLIEIEKGQIQKFEQPRIKTHKKY